MDSFQQLCEDGCEVSGFIFHPKSKYQGDVIIAPAMGIEQSYYQPIAQWLSHVGYKVYTFDYRGIGKSKQRPLKYYQSSIVDWMEHDASSVLALCLKQSHCKPLYWLGHSLGGQLFPMVKQIDRVTKVITIASGTGYWRYNAPQIRKKIWPFWHIVVPLSIKLYGYYPGKKIGMVGDLPASIMQQWRKWCLHPDYCIGVEDNHLKTQFEQFNVPLDCINFTDDEMLSQRNFKDLFAMFGSENKRYFCYSPESLKVDKVGHLGFFKKQFRENLWPEIILPQLNPY